MNSSFEDRRSPRRSLRSFSEVTLPFLLLMLLALPACRTSPRSHRSYDQIRDLVAGKTATEVEQLLGKPDLRETVLDDQRWIWWNYTFLDGDQYAPEIRGQVVHLEITFQNPSTPGADARVGSSLSVGYSKPSRSP